MYLWKRKQHNREYDAECTKFIMEKSLINMVSMLVDNQNSDMEHALNGVLKNMLILHGKNISPSCLIELERHAIQLQNDYIKNVLFKMIDNIRKKVAWDNIGFREIHNVARAPPIPIEERIVIEQTLPQLNYERQIKKAAPKFKVGQIVGAKDKENKWWLSRILHVYDTPKKNSYWYYVRFEGWGKEHDEWIDGSSYRVRQFNSRKHFLKK